MNPKGKTAAEEQIELLRRMKEARLKRKAAPVPAAPKAVAPLPPPALSPVAPLAQGAPPAGEAAAFELAEGPAPKPRAKAAHGLPVGRETWRRLRERQRATHEFKRRRDMGEWAAELVLALPPHAHALNDDARAELFRRMREWCLARGLR